MNLSDPHGGNGDTVHLFHHSFCKGGGMERYAMMLADGFHKLGCRVVFHAYRADPALAKSLGVELDNVWVTPFPRKLRDFRFFWRVDKLRREVQGHQISLTRVRARDVVISGGTHRGYLGRARKIAGPFDWLQIWMEREAYRHARIVIAHSNLCAAEVDKLYQVPGTKVSTLFPPVDDRFGPTEGAVKRTESRRRLGLPSDKVVFLFPSMGHSRKGFGPICRVLGTLSDQLVLAVAGKPPSRGTRPWVRYLGYLEDMAEAYRAADFTILGSYYEPFGLVGPESVLCGTRLVFEENVGCLAAIKPEAVFTFSVWDADSIRTAASRALALAQQGHHHLDHPRDLLLYDPSPTKHAAALLRVAAR